MPRDNLRSSGRRYALDGTQSTGIQAEREIIIRRFTRTWLPLQLPSQPAPRSNQDPRGITNFNGVSCYMSAALQSSMHTPIFLNWICSHDPIPGSRRKPGCGTECLKCDLRGFVESYWEHYQPGHEQILQDDQLDSIWEKTWARTALQQTNQEDANEFFEYLLAAIRRHVRCRDGRLRHMP